MATVESTEMEKIQQLVTELESAEKKLKRFVLRPTEFREKLEELGCENVHTDVIRRHCKAGIIEAVKINGVWYIPKTQLKKYANNRPTVGRPSLN